MEGTTHTAEFMASATATKKRDYRADHARRALRKAGLTAEQAAQAVQNVQERNTGATAESILKPMSRGLKGSLSEWLFHSFTWDESPQGYKYWCDIYKAHGGAF